MYIDSLHHRLTHSRRTWQCQLTWRSSIYPCFFQEGRLCGVVSPSAGLGQANYVIKKTFHLFPPITATVTMTAPIPIPCNYSRSQAEEMALKQFLEYVEHIQNTNMQNSLNPQKWCQRACRLAYLLDSRRSAHEEWDPGRSRASSGPRAKYSSSRWCQVTDGVEPLDRPL